MFGFGPTVDPERMTFATVADFEAAERLKVIILICVVTVAVGLALLAWRWWRRGLPAALRSRKLLHWAGVVLMIFSGGALVALRWVEAGRWVTTGIAMVARELAFLAMAHGPAMLLAWRWGKASEGAPTLPARAVLGRYALIGLMWAFFYLIAELAFPGPWLSSGGE